LLDSLLQEILWIYSELKWEVLDREARVGL